MAVTAKPPKKTRKTTDIDLWISSYFAGDHSTPLTSEELAKVASKHLEFTISASRLVKALDHRGIMFKRGKGDPKKKSRTRIDLLTNRIRTLEERLTTIENRP